MHGCNDVNAPFVQFQDYSLLAILLLFVDEDCDCNRLFVQAVVFYALPRTFKIITEIQFVSLL